MNCRYSGIYYQDTPCKDCKRNPEPRNKDMWVKKQNLEGKDGS